MHEETPHNPDRSEAQKNPIRKIKAVLIGIGVGAWGIEGLVALHDQAKEVTAADQRQADGKESPTVMTNDPYRQLCIGDSKIAGFYPSAEAHKAWTKKKRKERPTNITAPKKKRKKR